MTALRDPMPQPPEPTDDEEPYPWDEPAPDSLDAVMFASAADEQIDDAGTDADPWHGSF